LRVDFRHEPRRPVAHIRNDPQPVECIEAPRLGRNIRRGVVQSEERLQVLPLVFAHDFAVPVFVEAVDHDAVEAGERADLLRRDVAERPVVAGRLQPAHAGTHARVESRQRIAPGLQLQDDHAARLAMVDNRVEDSPVAKLDRQGIPLTRKAAIPRDGDVGPRRLRHDARNRLAEQSAGLDAQMRAHAVAGLRDEQLRFAARQKRAMRLNSSRNVNRLAVAVAQVD
jgi:hypothetical protein